MAQSRDNPRACVDPPDAEETEKRAWAQDMNRLVDAQLPKLLGCSVLLPTAAKVVAHFRLGFDSDGAPRSQHLVESTASECRATECVKRALAGLRAPPAVVQREPAHHVNLLIEAGQTPLRINSLPPGFWTPADPNTCHDQDVPGQVPPREIQRIVRSHYRELRACYDQALQRNPYARGGVMFGFVIGGDGRVSSVRISSNALPDCAAVRCMQGWFRRMTFPQPNRGGVVTVQYPIMFAPR
jgi:hypothetical protein